VNLRQRNRRDLRHRMQNAQYIIFRRKGYAPGIAKKMAREFTDQLCKQITSREGARDSSV
jgi:hypothetical protein